MATSPGVGVLYSVSAVTLVVTLWRLTMKSKQDLPKRPKARDLPTLISTLRTKVVRDLAFAIGAPVLTTTKEMGGTHVITNGLNEILQHSEWLEHLDWNPQHLIKFIEGDKSAKMLGNYFAKLWEYYIANGPNAARKEGLNTKLQVFEGKRTVGAFDLLYQTQTGIHHWEVSFKCKLFVPPRSPTRDPPALIVCSGPHLSETLLDKVEKVRSQLLLGKSAPGENALKKIFMLSKPPIIHTRCVLNGYILYPLTPAMSFEANWAKIGKSGLRGAGGWWTEDLKLLRDLKPHSLWYILPKLSWLAPLSSESLQNLHQKGKLFTTGEFIREVERLRRDEESSRRRRVFVAEIGKFKNLIFRAWALSEISRGFVVDQGWEELFRSGYKAKRPRKSERKKMAPKFKG
ncbi:hypothetical protein AAMO2058_001480100 [Amorphochlora amoebiformis]